MYGLVNKAVEGLVCQAHGENTWRQIKEKAGVTEESFISNQSYPDSVTYDLVGAASEVLGAPADEILRAFGEYWVLVIASESYGDLMDAAGRNLPDFLTYLPNFHARVQLIFPRLKPPSFTVDEIGENSLVLHYYSHREGLQDFVVGLIQGLGKRFSTPATCTYQRGKAEGEDHDIFLVEWTTA